ncbi:hypothetical protein CspeluHIS016_0205500 [Cutaneotrichosporon spelunceum]|uniref:Uncharacterized protein n=1 Tax=Cutaneotrichosporon spelunceum TaxID=1672016 RepID=A0AAD3YB83_9TREE|nr:hypothetical protein CspeluHIS016_0205500 [Cutaneotrichosporon spelunceum]
MPSQPIAIGAQDASAPRSTPDVGLSQSAGGLFGKWNAFSMNSTQTTSPKDNFDAHVADEFGDIGDLRQRGWAAAQQRGTRRAMSMSMSPTAVSGFSPMSPPQANALRDNLSRGEGALRRLSLGGFGKPTPMPMAPAQPAVPAPPVAQSAPRPEPMLAPPARPADRPVGHGRRRFSESSGRRRGVSPMGERILRDHLS